MSYKPEKKYNKEYVGGVKLTYGLEKSHAKPKFSSGEISLVDMNKGEMQPDGLEPVEYMKQSCEHLLMSNGECFYCGEAANN